MKSKKLSTTRLGASGKGSSKGGGVRWLSTANAGKGQVRKYVPDENGKLVEVHPTKAWIVLDEDPAINNDY